MKTSSWLGFFQPCRHLRHIPTLVEKVAAYLSAIEFQHPELFLPRAKRSLQSVRFHKKNSEAEPEHGQLQDNRMNSKVTGFVARALAYTLALSALLGGTAIAQNEQSTPKETYEVDFFERFRPQSALDIVLQVPGFTFDKGEDVRGFSGAAGNVLINGARPSSKGGGIEDALKRIPASQVLRVEVNRGSTSGTGETTGQAVTVNIVRQANRQSGRWSVGLRYPLGGQLSPELEAVVTRPLGSWDGSFKLNSLYDQSPRDGVIERRDKAGSLIFIQDEERPSSLTDLFLSSDLGRKFGDRELQLNSRFGFSRFKSTSDRVKQLPGDANPIEIFSARRNSRYWEGELGADWTQPLANGYKWRVIAVATKQHWWVVAPTVIDDLKFNQTSGSDYRYERDKFEGILRTTFSDTKGKFRPEFGGEFAYNQADFDISLSRYQGSNRQDVNLPASNVLVKELRGEAFANANWQATRKLTLETGVAVEVSRITVSGDASSSQTLSYLKPKAALVYQFSNSLQTRLAFERSVGQLDFSDFAASANFESDREFGGNPALKPHRSSKLGASGNWTFSKGGALNLELFHTWRSGVLEQILLPSGAYGKGNAGNATLRGMELSLTAPLSFALKGAQLTVKSSIVKSRFLDPITGEHRRLNYEDKPTLELQFRHDPESLPVSWGGGFKINNDNVAFHPNEFSLLKERSRWDAFIETSALRGLRVRLDATHGGSFWGRSFYTPDRGGEFSGSETHDRDAVLAFKLTVSGQF